MALDMGNELESQNAQISRISDKAEMNQGRIHGANDSKKPSFHSKEFLIHILIWNDYLGLFDLKEL